MALKEFIVRDKIAVANSSAQANLDPVSLIISGTVVNTTVISIGGSTVNATVIARGANVYMNSTTVFVGTGAGNTTANSSVVKTGQLTITGAISANGGVGSPTHVLTSDGTKAYWAAVPVTGLSTRVYQRYTATASQNTFTVSGGYTVGNIDVYYNGVHLANNEYTATNGTTVVLAVNAVVDSIIEVSGYK